MKKILYIMSSLLFICCNQIQKDVKKQVEHKLKAVSVADFEVFVNETNYITDAEKYKWSFKQLDVYNFEVIKGANWRKPDGINLVQNKNLPVTQVSYNDAIAYCTWKKERLPTYEEYWQLIANDNRTVVTNNKYPISNIAKVNVLGNVWDITKIQKNDSVRLAGGSLYCSPTTCHGTSKERILYFDRQTANTHIGFATIKNINH